MTAEGIMEACCFLFWLIVFLFLLFVAAVIIIIIYFVLRGLLDGVGDRIKEKRNKEIDKRD